MSGNIFIQMICLGVWLQDYVCDVEKGDYKW
jgi:hypothetical protein